MVVPEAALGEGQIRGWIIAEGHIAALVGTLRVAALHSTSVHNIVLAVLPRHVRKVELSVQLGERVSMMPKECCVHRIVVVILQQLRAERCHPALPEVRAPINIRPLDRAHIDWSQS